jgi:dTDP-4-dehydrorhamnose reductase
MAKKMRYLVLGASGMAGHMISLFLQEQGHEVVGFCRRKVPYVKTIVGDAADIPLLEEIIRNGKYDIVINVIGILNQYAETEKEKAVFLNSYLPHLLARITQQMDTRIIHLSTDCVFSGKEGRYKEDSFRDGESFYDRTKAVGELEDEKNLTLRTSIVGPDIHADGIGLFNWFMKQQTGVKGYTKVMWTGVTTLQLAKVMEEAAWKGAAGLYHMVYKENISKYELLKLFNHYFREDMIKIIPDSTLRIDKTLVRTRFDFDYEIPDYERMVSELAVWVKQHSYLYPLYDLQIG